MIILNINDVAKEAGVSKTTVSRVLLGGDKVKPATREKVMEVIKRLNYTPNTSAQMLAKKSNKVIGVINTYPINDPFYGYMNDWIASECERYNFGTLYVVCRGEANTGCEREIAMLYGKVDGFVILGNACVKREDVEKLVQMGMPVALFKVGFTCDGAISIDIDNEKGGHRAAQFLLKKGYKRIGYVHGSAVGSETDRGLDVEGSERYKGFQKAMKDAQIPIVEEFYGDRSFQTARNLAEKILKTDTDALFCETDLMAHGIVSALMEQHIRIPDQIAVLGFDGIKFRNYGSVIQLSTVEQPIERMAACIVGALVNCIENEVPYGKSQLFDTKIVEGKTT